MVGINEMKDKTGLRKADFWTSIILFAVGVALIGGATTFPMKDSYGGVQNVWYVSPALFPLLVAGALIVLSGVLFANAVVTGGARQAIVHFGGAVRRLAERDVRLIVIVALIAGYVYGLIPRMDFFVATVLFLQAFVVAFYVDRPALSKVHVAAFCALSVAMGVLAAMGVTHARGSHAALLIDVAGVAVFTALAAFAYACVIVRREPSDDRRRLRIALMISILVPLVLCPTFKYLLLVPLPTEGAVIEAMDTLQYALRGL